MDNAFERARAAYGTGAYDDATLEFIFPELKESEDERIRKDIVALIKFALEDGSAVSPGSHTTKEEALAYLEKQKEEEGYEAIPVESTLEYKLGFKAGKESEKQKEQPQEELVYRMNGLMQEYIKEGKDDAEKEHRFKCYHLFWDALEDADFFEQKEQKPAEVDESTKRLNDNWMKQHFDDYEEQKPAEWSEEDKGILLSIKCVIDSVWHNSDYDCSKEELKEMWNWLDTRWQRVEYPQPKREWSEEQDYSGLTDFERTIHRGFLAAGVENVPVGIIEDTAFECLGFLALNDDKSVEWDEYTKPQWKPSEDEDNKNSK